MFHLDPPFAGPIGTWPITLGFGPCDLAFEPPYTIDGITYPHFHAGTDFGLPMVTPVAAAAAGVVSASGWDQFGFGNRIIIDHGGGVQTLYGHLSTLKIGVGATTAAGDVIAYSGASGNATGPHLHFGVEQDGIWTDPLPWFAYVPPPPPPPPPTKQQYRMTTDQWLRAQPDATSARLIDCPVGAIVTDWGAPTPHWYWVTYQGLHGYILKTNCVPI